MRRCHSFKSDETNEYEERGDRKNTCYLTFSVVIFVPENGTNVEITRRSPIQILPLQPNKNGNFDTKLPFIFYAENAYMQGFSEIRKVSLCFFIRYFPVKMLLFA